MAISRCMLFWFFMVMRLSAVFTAPVSSIISRKLPNSKMVSEMAMAPLMAPEPSMPVMGAMNTSHNPCGLDSTMWYVPEIASPLAFNSYAPPGTNQLSTAMKQMTPNRMT